MFHIIWGYPQSMIGGNEVCAVQEYETFGDHQQIREDPESCPPGMIMRGSLQ